MSAAHKSFFLEGQVVGGFEEVPNGPGIYAYLPFRGIGHLRMVEERKKGRFPRCDFQEGDIRVSFSIQEIIGPRELRLDCFEQKKEPIQLPEPTSGLAPGRGSS